MGQAQHHFGKLITRKWNEDVLACSWNIYDVAHVKNDGRSDAEAFKEMVSDLERLTSLAHNEDQINHSLHSFFGPWWMEIGNLMPNLKVE